MADEGRGGAEHEAAGAVRWYAEEASRALSLTESGENGLSPFEAAARLERHGPNEVATEEEDPWWKLLLHQVRDPLIYILIAAGVVTLLIGHEVDAAVIGAVVLINTLIGFIQELRAQKAMRALSALAAPQAEVVRDGEHHRIPSRELVPGDIVLLTSGARVPADLRLLSTHDLELDESALTGESAPVRKDARVLEAEDLVPGDQKNMAFASTVATRGRGRGVVVRTGDRTELGQIAEAMRAVGQTTAPVQEKFKRLGHLIGYAVVGLSALVALVGWLRGLETAEIFLFAVATAVATVPEGLPVVLTVTLAIGVRRMAGRRAIIRSLPAVETLGSTTVIGSDKTGTLTLNRMSVREVRAGGRVYQSEGAGPRARFRAEGREAEADEEPALRWALLAAALANEAEPASAEGDDTRVGDPTETALLDAAGAAGLDPRGLRRHHPERDILPFESEQRFMATLNAGPDGPLVLLKGAPEVVLKRCDALLDAEGSERSLDRQEVLGWAREMAAEGYRVLATAHRAAPSDRLTEEVLAGGFVLSGLFGMEDPVRPEAVEAVGAARGAGIRVLMLTGDHAETARAIGGRLGLRSEEGNVVEGSALEGLDDAALDALLAEVDVFARVAPEHKLRIVQRLQSGGEIVAVTGDGVNDAPALRAAHLGIAMGKSGTDVAREASDMVLADDNFASITAAVEEGRTVFANIRKVTFFLLSTGVSIPLVIIVALLAGMPLPFLPAQVLWINLVTNGLQDVALAFEPGEPGQLERPPRSPGQAIVTRRIFGRLLAVGTLIAAGTLFTFWLTLTRTGDVVIAQSVAMTQMAVFQFFHVFNCRSLDRSIFRIPPFSNRFLFASFTAAWAAHLAVLHVSWLQGIFRTVPLQAGEWGLVLGVGALVIVGGELDKLLNRRRHSEIG
jgi:magnesium-transporting ATPase (P-type)